MTLTKLTKTEIAANAQRYEATKADRFRPFTDKNGVPYTTAGRYEELPARPEVAQSLTERGGYFKVKSGKVYRAFKREGGAWDACVGRDGRETISAVQWREDRQASYGPVRNIDVASTDL